MEEKTKEMAKVFKALGEPTRLKIINILASEGGYFCVGLLAEKLGVSQPAVSQHLKILKDAGILDSKRIGFHVHYFADAETLKNHKKQIDKLIENAYKKCKCPEGKTCLILKNKKL